jgi:hypothetical protein
MLMFDRRINDSEAAQEETISIAARRATAPNQASPGNAAGVQGGFTNLVTAPPTGTEEGLPLGVYPDEIGIDPEGNFWKPFHLGIDTFDDEFAYIPTGYPVFDYGN